MKRLAIILSVTLLLTSCGVKQELETVTDVQVSAETAQPRQIMLTLPEDAAAPVMEGDTGTLYLCDGYTVTLQTLDAGDLAGTVRAVTGFPKEKLQILQTRRDDADRYDCVWTAAGDGGVKVCRAAILDDGNYHYVLTAITPEASAGDLQEQLQSMFNSFRAVSLPQQLHTGS